MELSQWIASALFASVLLAHGLERAGEANRRRRLGRAEADLRRARAEQALIAFEASAAQHEEIRRRAFEQVMAQAFSSPGINLWMAGFDGGRYCYWDRHMKEEYTRLFVAAQQEDEPLLGRQRENFAAHLRQRALLLESADTKGGLC